MHQCAECHNDEAADQVVNDCTVLNCDVRPCRSNAAQVEAALAASKASLRVPPARLPSGNAGDQPSSGGRMTIRLVRL